MEVTTHRVLAREDSVDVGRRLTMVRRRADVEAVTRRFAVLVLAAILVLAAALWVAVVLPDGCPRGFHIRGVVCLSNGTHLAPSSGVRIPDFQTGLDN